MSENQGNGAASKTVVVLVLRRGPEDLSPEEKSVLESTFPGKQCKYVQMDPVDYLEHAADCRTIRDQGWAAVICYLPKERPIPSLAMEEGTAHVLVIDAKLQELLPLVPQFKVYTPSA